MHSENSRLGGATADVAVQGGTIRVETLGSGPPLLLVHGWTLDRRIWEFQAEALGARFRVIAFDRRGFGQSTAPPDLAREPEDIAAIADFLGLERFALIGMSQGARTALAFAMRYPERVSALVLQGAPLSGVPDADEALPLDAMAALAANGQFDAMRRLWRAHPLMQVEGARANACLDRIASEYGARDLLLPEPALDVTVADLARIRAPVLAITGGREPAWRHRVADILAAATGGSRIDIPGGRHLCNLSESEAYNAVLADFLETALCKA